MQGWVPQHLFLPAAAPQPAVWVLVTSARCTTCPPSPPQRPESPHTHAPPCLPRADVAVPGSCLRGERRARLMCDETESSEPLGGSGSKGARGVLRKGTRKDWSGGSRELGKVQGGRDVGYTSHYNINQHRACGVGYPALEVRKLRRTMMARRRKERRRNECGNMKCEENREERKRMKRKIKWPVIGYR